MTLSLRLSISVRVLWVALWAASSLYGTSQSIHWLALLSLSFVATLAVLRKPNVFLYWPIGLLVVMVSMYGAYWWQWVRTPQGVDASSARTLLVALTILFAVVAVLRVLLHRDVVAVPPLARMITVAIMTALPVILVYLVTSRWGDEPVRLISSHLAGGDRGAHNEIVHRLLKVSEDISYASPLQMYTYPQAIHFMIANLIALTQSSSTLPLLAQEYAMGVWVEWLQFAAFCQLATVVFMKGVQGSGLRRTLLLPPLMFVFASMDNFVTHLVWSGFTISLGITWILLAFLAVSDRMYFGDSLRRSWLSFAGLGFFSYASWIVYQPYAVIFLVLAGFFLIQIIARQKHLSGVMVSVANALERPMVMIFAVTSIIFIVLIGVFGSQSPAVVSLLLDGATFKPYLHTVFLWAFLAIAGQWLYSSSNETLRLDVGQLKFLFVHFGFVIGMIVTVMWSGGFGLLDQPYHTQKMLWILLFVSLPVALSVGSTWLEEISSMWTINKRFGLFAVVTLSLLLTPLVQGRLPVNATRKPTVDWFAKDMSVDVLDTGDVAVAFAWVDELESHVSNRELLLFSSVFVPVNALCPIMQLPVTQNTQIRICA